MEMRTVRAAIENTSGSDEGGCWNNGKENKVVVVEFAEFIEVFQITGKNRAATADPSAKT
jgi:hypothetical protein